MEIRPVGIIKDASAIEIRGGELCFLQQRPTLALAKNGRGFGGIVHEDLDANMKAGLSTRSSVNEPATANIAGIKAMTEKKPTVRTCRRAAASPRRQTR